MKRVLFALCVMLSCAYASAQHHASVLPTLKGWEDHVRLIRLELAQGKHRELSVSYAEARKTHDSPMLRAGHAAALAWWLRLAQARIEPVVPAVSDVNALLMALSKDALTETNPEFFIALYNLDDATPQFPDEGDYKVETQQVRVNGQLRNEEVLVVRPYGTSKDRRLQSLIERGLKLAPGHARLRAISARFLQDPAQRLRVLVAAYEDDPKGLGLLTLAGIVETASAAGQSGTADHYRRLLRDVYASEAETSQAKLLAKLRPALVK